jgi:hypothetical protein
MNLMAAVSSDPWVNALVQVIGVALCFWLLWWLLDYLKLPDPFNKVLRVLLALAAVVYLIRLILSITK